MYCSLRYNSNVDRISKLEFDPRNIYRYAVTPQVDLYTSELLQCRDSSLTLSNDNLNSTHIAAMIDIKCTC